jgi:hypothetical protein
VVELLNIVETVLISLYEVILHPNNHGWLTTTTTSSIYNNMIHLGEYGTKVGIPARFPTGGVGFCQKSVTGPC